MNRHVRLLFVLAAILVLLTTGAPGAVHSDGYVITLKDYEIGMPSQQAIIVWDEEKGHEDLILSIELLGSPEAAWIVPVPAIPEVETASADWFEMLAIDTKPKIEERIDYVYGTCDKMTIREEVVVSVELLSREEVGVYDVSILSADEPGALLDWLNDNGYAFPEEGGPILDAYVEEGGWYFVAARVLPDESEQIAGDVHPLWFSFDAQQPVYPMRLTALLEGSVDVLLYVLADHRMEAQPVEFSTEFAGEWMIDLIGRAHLCRDNPELRELFSHRPYYITKLWASELSSALMAKDLTFEQAETDEPFRAVNYEITTRCLKKEEAPPTKVASRPAASAVPTERPAEQSPMDDDWLLLGVGLGTLGVLAVLGLVWRRRSRRKPKDEEEA